MKSVGWRYSENNYRSFIFGFIFITLLILPSIQGRGDGFEINEVKAGSYIIMNESLVIDGDDDFEDNDNITGSGTHGDPYMISGFDMDEYSIIVKNTNKYFTITDINWGKNNDDYRLIFRNDKHVKIDNLTINSVHFLDGDDCNELIINNSRFSTGSTGGHIFFGDTNSVNITGSDFKYIRTSGYVKIKMEFYGNNGNTRISNSTFDGFDIISEIYGNQLVENCTFNSTILRPRGMSSTSEIRYNSFSLSVASGGITLYRYVDGCNYGSIHHNQFNRLTNGISIRDYYPSAPDGFLIKNNSFISCEQGIYDSQSRSFEITSNDFNYCTNCGIKLEGCDQNLIWKNRFINCGITVTGGFENEYRNKWDYEGCGNYWSDYSGTDEDGNGAYDIPYNISTGNIDMFPVTNYHFDIDRPDLSILTHSSGTLERSYNRIGWETDDEWGIKKVEFRETCGYNIDVTGMNLYPIFLDEGIHNISFKATDENGLFRIVYLNLELNRTYPVLNFTTLSDGCAIDNDPVNVLWDLVDYFPVVKQNFTIDGKLTQLETNVGSRILDLKEGSHSVAIMLTDDLGFEVTQIINFFVDRTAPIIELTGLAPGSKISSRAVNFDCRIVETIGLDSAGYRLDDGEWIEVSGDFSFEKILNYGDHEFHVEAVDGAKHITILDVPFEILKDNLVEVLSPENGTVFNTDSIDLDWTYGGKFHWSETFIRLGADKEFFSIGTSYDYEMEFAEDGEYLVTLILVDEVGNYIQSNFWVIRDTKDPTVGFLDVDDINYINTWKMDLSWNAVDNNGIDHYELKIDERDWDHKGLETSSELGLTEGEHTISIRAFDLAGNIDEAEIEVIVDITPPELEFLDMDVFTSTGIEIEWECDDNYGIESMFITIEGLKSKDVLGKDGYSITLNQDGRYLVTLNATDLAGNTESISTVIIVDTTEPRAVWKGAPISITNSTTITLDWEIDEDVGIDQLFLLVDGNRINLDINDTSYTIDLEDGSHTISLTVIDIGGWQYILNYPKEVLIDTEDPTLQIVDKIVGKDGTASFSWTVTDVTQSDLKVMISLDGEDYIEVLGDSYKTDMLPPGDHIIKIKIIDKAGNEAEETWSFTIEEEKDEVDGGSGGLIIIIFLIIVVLIIIAVGFSLFIFKKKGKETSEETVSKVTIPSRPPGIGGQRIDNNMLAAPPVNRLQELPAAGNDSNHTTINENDP